MEGTKKPWQSKTIWGAFFALIFSLLGLLKTLGLDVPQPSTEDINFLSEKTALLATSIGAAISALIAIWGRFKADKKIG